MKELTKLNDTQVAEALKKGTKAGREGQKVTVEQIQGYTDLTMCQVLLQGLRPRLR